MAITIDGIDIPNTGNLTIDNTQVLEVTIDGAVAWVYAYVKQPSNISPSDGASEIGEDCPTLEASNFSVFNSSDTHIEAEWKIVDTDSNTTVYQQEASM